MLLTEFSFPAFRSFSTLHELLPQSSDLRTRQQQVNSIANQYISIYYVLGLSIVNIVNGVR